MSDIVSMDPCIKCGAPSLADSVFCKACLVVEEVSAAENIAMLERQQVKQDPTEGLVAILIASVVKEGLKLNATNTLKLRSGLYKGIQETIFRQPPASKWSALIKWEVSGVPEEKLITNIESSDKENAVRFAVSYAQEHLSLFPDQFTVKVELEES